MASALLSHDFGPFQPRPERAVPARSLRYPNGVITIHADSHDTHGGFSLLEFSGSPGGEPPLHVHTREDELFYVFEGELTVRRGDETLVLQPGQSGFLPRNVPHTFRITSLLARFLIYVTPGGFEDYFRTITQMLANANAKPSPAEMSGVAARYGITFLP